MSAVLTADSGDIEKVAESITECNRMGIPVLPPDINESFAGFSVVKKENEPSKIRFGLTTIKNFGEGIADFIIEERKKGGHFKTLEEFLTRIQDRNLNKKSLEALIKTGAMDALGERMSLLHNIENLLTYNKQVANNLGQDSLFSSLSKSGYSPLYLAPIEPATETERLNWERELLGLYVSGHPLDKFRDKVIDQKFSIKKIKEESKEGEVVVVGGLLEEIKPFLTKKGDKMLFTKFRDLGDVIEMAVFPKTFAEFQSLLVQDACLAIKARVTLRNGEKSLVAEKVKKL
jgi:DNA polymerase-3 subunit alpha